MFHINFKLFKQSKEYDLKTALSDELVKLCKKKLNLPDDEPFLAIVNPLIEFYLGGTNQVRLVKRASIISEVWRYFKHDFFWIGRVNKHKVEGSIYDTIKNLEYPYFLEKTDADTIALLYKLSRKCEVEYRDKKVFVEDSLIKSKKHSLIIEPLPLFGKTLSLKITGEAYIETKSVGKATFYFSEPKMKLKLFNNLK